MADRFQPPPGYVVMVTLQAMLLAAAASAVRWWTLPGALVLLEAAQSRFPDWCTASRTGPSFSRRPLVALCS